MVSVINAPKFKHWARMIADRYSRFFPGNRGVEIDQVSVGITEEHRAITLRLIGWL
jgi:hypothetical protein